MSTRATSFLKQKKIPFEVVKYAHAEKGAEFAAKAVGFPLEKTVKTLIVDLDNKNYIMALMPGDKQLDLKALAKVCSVKRTAMANSATAERLTGYLIGGISPFGTKQNLSVVIEESILQYERVLINGGQRGVMLMMRPADIVKALSSWISMIARVSCAGGA